jgi:hypothetical protein
MKTSTYDAPFRVISEWTASGLTLAVCATFGTGPAHSAPVIVDINPDVTLGTFNLDINGDATNEFVFTRTDLGGGDHTNTVDAFLNGVVASDTKPGAFADALTGGELIDASRTFNSGLNTLVAKGGSSPGFAGEFAFAGVSYVGLRFDLPTTTGDHFGWVEVIRDFGTLTLTRYAYETEPGVGISTPVPEPGTIALLVAGAAGILAMRRRRLPR